MLQLRRGRGAAGAASVSAALEEVLQPCRDFTLMPAGLRAFREALSVKWDFLVTQRGKRFFSMRANECRNTLINTHNRNAASSHHFHSKRDLLIHYHTQPLLHDILSTFYDLSTTATPVLVPIDKSDIGIRG